MCAVRSQALSIGAKACYVTDLRREFVTDFVFPLIRANAIYEGRYLLGESRSCCAPSRFPAYSGTSIARPLIAKGQVEIAHKENCKYLAHGATGKGNDQVRFELTANALDPTLVTIVPWREKEFFTRFQGRQVRRAPPLAFRR
jgi:argininosuccinate synthase